MDEKPHIQALERAQGWLRLPNGRALTGQTHEYRRHGTTTLFAALNTVTGQVKAGHYERRRRREFLDLMNQVVAEFPDDVDRAPRFLERNLGAQLRACACDNFRATFFRVFRAILESEPDLRPRGDPMLA